MFEKDIMLLKGHERGTKKIRIRAHGLPGPMASKARSTAFGDPPSEFRKDLC